MTEQIEGMDQTIKTIADMEGKHLTFTLANEEYGISIMKIREIKVERHQEAEPSIQGLSSTSWMECVPFGIRTNSSSQTMETPSQHPRAVRRKRENHVFQCHFG